ncbi:MAG: hypothetical protein ACYDIA_07045, partial [Candidatus Humimicrobiaceae bacterium]
GEDIVASYDLRVNSYDLRVKEIRKLAKDTQSMLNEFQGEQKDMAAKLKKTFKQAEADRLKVEADRIKAFGSMKNEIQAEQEKRNKEVADLLEKFSKDHEDMAAKLRKTLEQGEVVRLKEVLDLLQEFKTEREKMSANWQALTAAMAKRRSIKPKVEAEVKVRSVKEVIKEETKEDIASPEIGLEEKVLGFIKRHPEGVKVGDMEEPLGVLRMRLGVVAKGLLEKGKVRKEENIYFPV